MHPTARNPRAKRATCELRAAFSFIELIGVVAIIVILSSLALPRILNPRRTAQQAMEGVNRARVEETLMSVRAIKTAAAAHYAKFGSLASRNGVPFPVAGSYDNYDAILLSEQSLDRPFAVRLGKSAVVRLVNISGRSSATRVAFSGGATVDGQSTSAAAASGYLLEAIISGVTEAEARALNDSLDGAALGANPGEDDHSGAVTYGRIQPNQLGVVHISISQH